MMHKSVFLAIICSFFVFLIVERSWAVKFTSFSSGFGVSLDKWEGEDPFLWNVKDSYDWQPKDSLGVSTGESPKTPAKTLFNAKLATTLKWSSLIYTDVELPFFYNRVLEYKTKDDRNNNYTANGYSIGVGNVGLSAKILGKTYFTKLQLFIPGLYDPKSDLGNNQVESGLAGSEARINFVDSWTGMGVYRMGLTSGMKGNYPSGNGGWYVYLGMDLVLGDETDFNWWLNNISGADLTQDEDQGKGLVKSGDRKFKWGGIHSRPVSDKLTFKTGVNMAYSLYHWYGKYKAGDADDRGFLIKRSKVNTYKDPRLEFAVEPSAGLDVKIAPGKSASLFMGFSLYNWSKDPFNVPSGKKIFLGVGFNNYF